MAAEKVSPFAWVDAITQKKSDPMEEYGEKEYPAFMVSRALSYFPDTILYAAEINLYQHMDAKLQYDYYRNSVRPKKRFAKWGKKKSSEDVKFLMEALQYSRTKAEQAASILTPEQIKEMKDSRSVGTEN